MTAAVATRPALADDEHEVLFAFAEGSRPDLIAANTGIALDRVNGILTRRASMNRTKARQALGLEPASPPPTTPIAPPPRPTTTPATPAGVQRSIEQLLVAGETHAQSRVRTLAARVRSQVEALKKIIVEEEELRSRRERVAELERQLAQAKALLPRAAAASTRARRGNAKAVREWAARAGVPCPSVGRLPREVLEAYAKATHRGGSS